MLTNKLTGAGAADKTYIEDVFSTYLYTGNGSTQTINNGIDLAGKGGLFWSKSRTDGTSNHQLVDTARGKNYQLETDNSGAQQLRTQAVSSFNNNGITLGSEPIMNYSGSNYASWTFRKAPKFFDVVTYTGNGSTQTINHNLGQAPGMIIVKCTSQASNWIVYHRSTTTPNNYYLSLNTTSSETNAGSNRWQVTSTTFQADAFSLDTNNSGQTYVAYLFAHDTTTDGLIQCGSFTCDSSGNAEVNLGWEPQYVMLKLTNTNSDWSIADSMRGNPTSGTQKILWPNLSIAESDGGGYGYPTATGMRITGWTSGNQGIYMAIRRGPMRTPTDGTKVFMPNAVNVSSGTRVTTGFPIDWQLFKYRPDTGAGQPKAVTRLTGIDTTGSSTNTRFLVTSTTAAEVQDTFPANNSYYWDNTGFGMPDGWSGLNDVFWNFRRSPGFFDVVCYTGTGAARTVNHNLGVAPELIIVKRRDATSTTWVVSSSYLPQMTDDYLALNLTSAISTITNVFTTPTASTFGYGTGLPSWGSSNNSGATYVAYLFASCPGVSKVGSYTGNGTSQTINCGFTNGARFVLIKRTNSTGDWYVWDTARGIVAANDPHLSLNTTADEVTTDDTIDPDSTGFIVNDVAATNVNVSGGSYIYLAIA